MARARLLLIIVGERARHPLYCYLPKKMLCPYSGHISEGIHFRGFELRLFAVEVSRMLHGVSVAVLGKGSGYARLAISSSWCAPRPLHLRTNFWWGIVSRVTTNAVLEKRERLYPRNKYPLYGIIVLTSKPQCACSQFYVKWRSASTVREACSRRVQLRKDRFYVRQNDKSACTSNNFTFARYWAQAPATLLGCSIEISHDIY